MQFVTKLHPFISCRSRESGNLSLRRRVLAAKARVANRAAVLAMIPGVDMGPRFRGDDKIGFAKRGGRGMPSVWIGRGGSQQAQMAEHRNARNDEK